jgi:regulatory protein
VKRIKVIILDLVMDIFEKFYNYSLRFLSYRQRSEKEVRDKLITKQVDLQIIEKIISKLKEKKFINDEEFARGWVENRIRFKPRSARLMGMELKQKGISQEIIESSIKNQELGPENDLEQAKRLVEKKIGRFRNKFGMTRNEVYQKLGRFLASKGFSWDIIKKAIDHVQFHERG